MNKNNFFIHTKNMNTILMCLEVFFGRMVDVSIGSVRTIFLVKQKNLIACFLAFIEILIWFLIARQILTDREINFLVVISYAGGYAFGTYVGGLINKYFVKGTLTAMIVSTSTNLLDALKDAGYGITSIPLENNKSLYIVEFNKKSSKKFRDLVKHIDKNAFIIVNDTLSVDNGFIS